MVDGSQLIPEGFHFINFRTKDLVGRQPSKWHEHNSVQSLRYYIIDFGLSAQYPLDKKGIKNKGPYGQDRSVPEHRLGGFFDPFKVETYQLGNVILRIAEVRIDFACFSILADHPYH